MALITGLRVVESLDGMDLPEIGSVGFRNIVCPVIRDAQVRVNAAALVAVEAELLIMAIHAVLSGSPGEKAMFPKLVRAVRRSNARTLVTICAVF
jgi:hypothetical protein